MHICMIYIYMVILYICVYIYIYICMYVYTYIYIGYNLMMYCRVVAGCVLLAYIAYMLAAKASHTKRRPSPFQGVPVHFLPLLVGPSEQLGMMVQPDMERSTIVHR